MKKIIYPLTAGGAPYTNELIAGYCNNELWTAIEAILSAASPPANASAGGGMIITGCNLTGAGPYNCSAGIVYINGQFMAFPGFTAQTLPQYVLPSTLVNNTDTWGNGTVNNLWSQQDATFQAGVPGSGQYITLQLGGYPGFDGPSPAGYRADVSQLDRIGMGALQAINVPSGVVTSVVLTAGVYFINSACTGGPFASAQGLLFCLRGNANEKVLIMITTDGRIWMNVRTGGSYLGWVWIGGSTNVAWTNMTLINGWANGGTGVPRYRIYGPIFEMTGMVDSFGKTNNIFCNTLPSIFITTVGGAMNRAIVNQNTNAFAQLALTGGSGGGAGAGQIVGAAAGSHIIYDISCSFSVDAGN